MKAKKPSRKDLLSGCAQPGHDDGLDPRFDRSDLSNRVENRKALQLCGQVEQTLHGVLADCADEVLRSLLVVSVVPAPNTSRLLVSVSLSESDITAERSLEHLLQAQGKMRAEIASAIHRRRTPELTFRIVN